MRLQIVVQLAVVRSPGTRRKYDPKWSTVLRSSGGAYVHVAILAAYRETSLPNFDVRDTLNISSYKYIVVPAGYLARAALDGAIQAGKAFFLRQLDHGSYETVDATELPSAVEFAEAANKNKYGPPVELVGR